MSSHAAGHVVHRRALYRNAGAPEKMPRQWRSTPSRGFKPGCVPRLHAEASPELKKARALLVLMPKLDEARWTQAVKTLYQSERIEGARAVSWLLNVLASVSYTHLTLPTKRIV